MAQCVQLPLGLIAQMVQHCSVIAEVMGSMDGAVCPAPTWLDSSDGTALYRYRRGHGEHEWRSVSSTHLA